MTRPALASACALGAATLITCLPRARAQGPEPDPIVLAWRAPAGCPTQAEVRARIDALLGRAPGAFSSNRVGVRATAETTGPDAWKLEMTVESADGRGQRRLEANSCRELAEATALIAALAFDPAAVKARAEEEARQRQPIAPPAIPLPPSAPAPAPSRDTIAPRPTPTTPMHVGGAFGGYVDGDAGPLPQPALGFGGELALLIEWARIELSFTHWLSQDQLAPGSGRQGASFSFYSGGATFCGRLVPGQLEVGLCAGSDIGRMSAFGYGVAVPVEESFLWLASRAGAALTWLPDPRTGVRLSLYAVVPWNRPTWVIEGSGAVDQPAAIGARGTLGAELRF